VSRVITGEAAAAIWEAIERQNAADEAAMPDTIAAMIALQRARERLQKLGWREGIYCPKDGSSFAIIQYGSTGIFDAAYVGDWPTGSVWIADETCAPQGVMWKAFDKLTDAERARMDACTADQRACIDRLGKSFTSTTPTTQERQDDE
jgi:hypothetical protein